MNSGLDDGSTQLRGMSEHRLVMSKNYFAEILREPDKAKKEKEKDAGIGPEGAAEAEAQAQADAERAKVKGWECPPFPP